MAIRKFPANVHNNLVDAKILKAVAHFADKVKKANAGLASDEEIIGICTGFRHIETNVDCGGYFDHRSGVIAINEKHRDNIHVLSHEICHYIQLDLGIEIGKNILLSEEVLFEQQCETMAYHFCKILWNIDRPELFNSYFNKQDIEFLANWHQGFLSNDLIGLRKG